MMNARFDLMGGWTDAPPYYLECPAAVINLQLPQFEVRVERSEGYKDNMIIDACYKVLGIVNDRSLKLVNTIPRSAGLGGSSIVAAEVVKKIKPMFTERETINTVLDVEEEIGTRGGWQDVIGGMYSGIKLTQTSPDRVGHYQIERIKDEEFLRHCLLIDTGIRREKPSPIMKKYAQGDKFTKSVLDEIRDNALRGWEFLKAKQYFAFASLMEQSWRLVCVAEEIEPVEFDGPVGYKTAGAAGGGFIFAIYENRPENLNLPDGWKVCPFPEG
ncbi:MAG: hypothetical protein HQ539_03080 [Parcubacteria group bacterium]|nr:hypothetical protein [Parcubacteria group bacterium]